MGTLLAFRCTTKGTDIERGGERETTGRCFMMNSMLRYYTKLVSESADSDILFKEVRCEEGVTKGVCN